MPQIQLVSDVYRVSAHTKVKFGTYVKNFAVAVVFQIWFRSDESKYNVNFHVITKIKYERKKGKQMKSGILTFSS